MRLLNLRPDRVIIKAYIRECRKKPLDHRAVHSISRTFHAFCRSRKPDHRTYKLVLQPCCLRRLSADTRAPGTSRAACGLLTLITEHFLIHFIYLHIFPRLFPRDSRQPIQAANTVFAVLPISDYSDTPAVLAAAITDKSSCFPVRHRRTMYALYPLNQLSYVVITTFLNRLPGNNFHTSTSHTFRRPERSQPLFIISCANQEFSEL